MNTNPIEQAALAAAAPAGTHAPAARTREAQVQQAALWQATQQVHHEPVASAQSPLPRDAEPPAHGAY